MPKYFEKVQVEFNILKSSDSSSFEFSFYIFTICALKERKLHSLYSHSMKHLKEKELFQVSLYMCLDQNEERETIKTCTKKALSFLTCKLVHMVIPSFVFSFYTFP